MKHTSRLALLVTAAVTVTAVGARSASAASPATAVSSVSQKTHQFASGGSTMSTGCLNKVTRTAAKKAAQGQKPNRDALQRSANRSCKVTAATLGCSKVKSVNEAGKALVKSLRGPPKKASSNRLGVALVKSTGRRATVAIVTRAKTSTPVTGTRVASSQFVPRARAEFICLLKIERVLPAAQRTAEVSDGISRWRRVDFVTGEFSQLAVSHLSSRVWRRKAGRVGPRHPPRSSKHLTPINLKEKINRPVSRSGKARGRSYHDAAVVIAKLTVKGEARREAILESAAKLFDVLGYHRTSIALIAEDAETTKANIYHYFKAKHDILFAIYDSWIDDLTDMFEDHVRDEPDVDRAVRLVFDDLMFIILGVPSQVRVYFQYARELPPHQRSQTQSKRDRYGVLVESVIQRGIDEGAFPQQSAHVASLGLLGMCAWASQWSAADESLDHAETAEHFANIFLHGARSGTAAPPAPQA